MTSIFKYIKGNKRSNADYYAYGLPVQDSKVSITTPYLYCSKEFYSLKGINLYDFHARTYAPDLCRFLQPDPKAGDYHWLSPYTFCGGDPINCVDPSGKEWKIVQSDSTQVTIQWVNPKDAYDANGNLLPMHYKQVIQFSATGVKGSYDKTKQYNIGTSTATVYKADGSTEEFDACTNPSDPENYATVPEGIYEAKVGLHKQSYPALRMGDLGTENFYDNSIELGTPNPSNPRTTKAVGINIHKAGYGNKTGATSDGGCVSKGCLLIDRNRWDSFINIFNSSKQRK